MKKKIIITLVIVVLIGITYYFASPFFIQPEAMNSKEADKLVAELKESNVVPTYTEAELDFVHEFSDDYYAFTGSAMIDIDGDGTDELFIGGGEGQDDGLFKFENGKFVNINSKAKITNKSATGGAVSIDADNDGDEDLYVTRFDGIYLYTNNRGVFSETKLDAQISDEVIPLSIAVGDINNDSLPDLYVSTFRAPRLFKVTTFNDPNNRSENYMFLNKGNNKFEDVIDESGLTYIQNTFQAVFVDLDNDNDQDLVVAPNTDKVAIFRNNGEGFFDKIAEVTEFGFWMGLAVGDADNDGDQDLFFSNIGITVPVSAARGDLRAEQKLDPDWAYIRNDGDLNFTNATADKKLNGYEFGWGAIFEDLNINGSQDLLVTENYIKWPAHKLKKLDGRVFIQGDNEEFIPINDKAGLHNPFYGTSPITSDFNRDGYPDVVFVNFSGPSKAYLSNAGENNFLKVIIPNNAKSLGTRVDVERKDGVTISKQLMVGIGLMTDNGAEMTFGLGQSDVRQVRVSWPSGKVDVIEDVEANTELVLKVK